MDVKHNFIRFDSLNPPFQLRSEAELSSEVQQAENSPIFTLIRFAEPTPVKWVELYFHEILKRTNVGSRLCSQTKIRKNGIL